MGLIPDPMPVHTIKHGANGKPISQLETVEATSITVRTGNNGWLHLIIIIAGDQNPKHPAWNSGKTNQVGVVFQRHSDALNFIVDASVDYTNFRYNSAIIKTSADDRFHSNHYYDDATSST